jgi:hypothetical protein
MTTPSVRIERRVGQRFPYALAVSVLNPVTSLKGVGFTQDLSSRGAFFFTDVPLSEGAEIELTLKMPSEITLGESMPVRCRARVLRVVSPTGTGMESADGKKIGVAVRLESYEYLAVLPEASAGFARISTLHSDREEKVPQSHSPSPLLQG